MRKRNRARRRKGGEEEEGREKAIMALCKNEI